MWGMIMPNLGWNMWHVVERALFYNKLHLCLKTACSLVTESRFIRNKADGASSWPLATRLVPKFRWRVAVPPFPRTPSHSVKTEQRTVSVNNKAVFPQYRADSQNRYCYARPTSIFGITAQWSVWRAPERYRRWILKNTLCWNVRDAIAMH